MGGNPLSFIDPRGLSCQTVFTPLGIVTRCSSDSLDALLIPPKSIPQQVQDFCKGAADGAKIAADKLKNWLFNVTQVPENKPPFVGEPGSTVQEGTGSRTYGADG